MLRTCEVNLKKSIHATAVGVEQNALDRLKHCFRPHLLNVFWATIWYKYHRKTQNRIRSVQTKFGEKYSKLDLWHLSI